ncbi:imidazoleglycerol-phosphate dehydratase HisB [Patescibacteria group bacterium]|nr:imidazoleglycerol-phosphate dehydratase HisB [Patescibacteria group bacterium]
MKKRTATIKRKTGETDITVKVNLDGTGKYQIDTGIGFFNHLLELFSRHSLIDLLIKAKGDLKIDEHHLVEDVGICFGQAIRKALGNKKGIERYGFLLPMDDALAEVALDLGGRPYLVWNVSFKREKIGDMPTELFEDFFRAIANNLQANIHINLRYGRNEHHIAESIFKALARAMRLAISRDERVKDLLPTTKGIL